MAQMNSAGVGQTQVNYGTDAFAAFRSQALGASRTQGQAPGYGTSGSSGPIPKNDETQFSHQKKDKDGEDGFSLLNALKKAGKGIISPITVFFQHPVMAFGGLLVGILACSLVPGLAPALAIGSGVYSLYQTMRGIINAIRRYQAGDFRGAENAFEDIGAGATGTALGALGLRATAAMTAEAKATHIAVKAGKSAEEAAEAASIAIRQTKNMGFVDLLKENASILTTGEGRSALASQLRPGAIRQRGIEIYDYIRNPGPRETTPPTSPVNQDFLQTPEGRRRAGLLKADISRDADPILMQAMDELGIPPELRPQFYVEDELRFLSKDEIEALVQKLVREKAYIASDLPSEAIPRVQVFQDGETPIQFTNEQIAEKAKAALIKVYDEMGVSQRNRYLSHFSFGDKDYIGANYNAGEHRIRYHANSYRKGRMTLEEALAHEAKHAEQAILRMQLSDGERAAIIQDELLRFVLQGEAEEIIHRGSLLGPQMMKPPKIGAGNGMREKIVALLKDEIYPNAEQYLNDFHEIYLNNVGVDNPGYRLHNYGRANKPNLDALVEKLKGIVDDHPEFVKQYEGGRDAAIIHLLDYMEAHALRFEAFSTPEIHNSSLVDKIRQLPLSDAKRQEAIQSLRDLIATLEGNGRQQGFANRFFGNSAAFDQYQFSPEEVLARNSAAHFEKGKIEAKLAELKGASAPDPQLEKQLVARLAELELEIQRNDLGQKMYQAYTRHINDPDNQTLLGELNQFKEQYQALMNKIEGRVGSANEADVLEMTPPLRNTVVIRGWDDSERKKTG